MWVLAQGQKPSQSPQHTKKTRGWLGCDLRSSSKQSTKMGVTISKRWGLSLIVFATTKFASSDFGIDGRGEAVSNQSAEEHRKCSQLSHILYLRYFRWSSCARIFLWHCKIFPHDPLIFISCRHVWKDSPWLYSCIHWLSWTNCRFWFLIFCQLCAWIQV